MGARPRWAAAMALCAAFGSALPEARDDILIADFEGETYGDWKATGEAFGPGPARGTLPKQMEVSGFLGERLVNSYRKGDDSMGTLSSPPFRIERRYIAFLIGGGRYPGETCIDLIVDGKVVRTATGPNDRPGGSERLDWSCWDVAEIEGKTARIEITDRRKGGWGHITIDHIIQTDRPRGALQRAMEIAIERDYLSFRFPPKAGPRTMISLAVDGKVVRSAAGRGRERPVSLSWDVGRLKGKRGTLSVQDVVGEDGRSPLAESVGQGDRPVGAVIVVDRPYRETYRPQFHFTARENWLNDPNGLVFYAGEYHLFFQHNPSGTQWGNMTWGHAVSPDLLHWTQLEHAIRPDALGTIFSGSAVVDGANTAGFRSGDEKVLVAIYTSAGGTSEESRGRPFVQSIAYSNDRGRTWTKHAGNPVLGHIAGQNRDPKVIWHEPTRRWVLALYLDGNDYALFRSPDLEAWEKLCDVPMPGTSECPDFFPLAVDGDPSRIRWVFWGGNGNYRLGRFDGMAFVPETDVFRSHWGANDYAAQTWSDIPPEDGRRIQIAWMSGGEYPGMPFNQQMSFPRVLSLRTTPEGVRLHFEPVREIERIRGPKRVWADLALAPGADPLVDLEGELWDIDAAIAPAEAAELTLEIRGTSIAYDARAGKLRALGREAPLPAEGGRIALRILVDRTSIEIFAASGRILMNFCFLPDPADRSLGIRAAGGAARIERLEIWPLRSIWPAAEDG